MKGEASASGGRTQESRALLWALIALEAFLTWTGPLSLALVLALPWLPRLPLPLVVYAAAEAVFLLEFVGIRRPSLLALSAPLPAPSAAERDRVFSRTLAELESDGLEIARERLVGGWFVRTSAIPRGRRWLHRWRAEPQWRYRADTHDPVPIEEIRRDNLCDLLASAFFQRSLEHVKARPQQHAALERYLAEAERVLQHKFEPGRNEDVYCIKHGDEVVRLEHRPLVFYVGVLSATACVEIILRAIGFERRAVWTPTWQRRGHLRVQPFRTEYWYHAGIPAAPGKFSRLVRHIAPRVEDQPAHRPVVPLVVISGLGGLVSMLHFVAPLLLASRRPIFLVGNPHVSLRLVSAAARRAEHALVQGDAATGIGSDDDADDENALWDADAAAEDAHAPVSSVPTLADQARAVRTMLHAHGFVSSRSRRHDSGRGPGVVLVSHSLGTSLASHLARVDPSLVAHSVLIDPIVFGLFDGHLVRAFIYADALDVGQRFVRLFSREAGIALTLNRAFSWFACAAFAAPETVEGDLDRHRTFVVLSERDCLVRSDRCSALLERAGVPFTVLPGALHAEAFMRPHFTAELIRLVIKCADGARAPAKRRSSGRTPVLMVRPLPSPSVSLRSPLPSPSVSRPRARSSSISMLMAMTPRVVSPLGSPAEVKSIGGGYFSFGGTADEAAGSSAALGSSSVVRVRPPRARSSSGFGHGSLYPISPVAPTVL